MPHGGGRYLLERFGQGCGPLVVCPPMWHVTLCELQGFLVVAFHCLDDGDANRRRFCALRSPVDMVNPAMHESAGCVSAGEVSGELLPVSNAFGSGPGPCGDDAGRASRCLP
ncbi:hypothetical protein CATMIT_01655 [Catenibacterium mitsuokai DSM 15897]|nr:hypothetical protein CATMIT_01655 [Catenibacterium mitsuokai DSM 15897]